MAQSGWWISCATAAAISSMVCSRSTRASSSWWRRSVSCSSFIAVMSAYMLPTPYGVGSMYADITAMKELQETLRRHQDELARVLRLHTIDEMAAAVAHEIHQPLCAITNYAQGGVRRL